MLYYLDKKTILSLFILSILFYLLFLILTPIFGVFYFHSNLFDSNSILVIFYH